LLRYLIERYGSDTSVRIFPLSSAVGKGQNVRKVDLLTSEGKTKSKVYNVLRLVHCIETVKDTGYLKRRDRNGRVSKFLAFYPMMKDELVFETLCQRKRKLSNIKYTRVTTEFLGTCRRTA
jgi:hypothetical protein